MWVEIRQNIIGGVRAAGHPLREDVSWNDFARVLSSGDMPSSSSWGCELKCSCPYRSTLHISSSSSWGCELKYYVLFLSSSTYRHPLREDVSWNVPPCIFKLHILSSSSWGCELKFSPHFLLLIIHQVILFVRMWVEIEKHRRRSSRRKRHPLREDVSWNDLEREIREEVREVILFVRMWVEMFLSLHLL